MATQPPAAAKLADPVSIMARETRVRHGAVPDGLGNEILPEGMIKLAGEEFLLRAEGLGCYYRRGEGVTVRLDRAELEGNLALYLAGSVHAAIACINGLFPVHASGVVVNERVFGITGPSGAGKSTLAAALNRRGHPLCADDTLVLDMERAPPLCLPGHKRMKLWPDAVALTDAEAQDVVSPAYPKYYVTAGGSDIDRMLPLAGMLVLAEGPELAFDALSGGARIAALDDDHYIAQLHEMTRGAGPAGRFAALAELAAAAPVYRFTRPWDRARFPEMLDFVEQRLKGLAGS